MALRTSRTPADGLRATKELSLRLKAYVVGQSAAFAQATTNRVVVTALAGDLRKFRDEFALIAAIPGMAEYARAQENDANYDIVFEFTAMLNVLDAAITEIVTTYPKGATGEILERTMNSNGTTSLATFTAANLAALRTRLNAIAAAVN